MRTVYVLAPLLASVKVMANPIIGFIPDKIKPDLAPDPSPAPAAFPRSTDGVLDGSQHVWNYNSDPNAFNGTNCWTLPSDKEPLSELYTSGKCSVCVIQRTGTDGSDDYLLWARDADNKAMGNMGQTTMYALDDQTPETDGKIRGGTTMGGYPLLMQSLRANDGPHPDAHAVSLAWATSGVDASYPQVFDNPAALHAFYDPSVGKGGNCSSAGSATNGAVQYFICFFEHPVVSH